MPELGAVADTLFIPILGRIYASEYCKSILTDEKALSIKDKLPKNQLERGAADAVLLARLRSPFRKYGPNDTGFSGPKARRRHRSTGLRTGDHVLPK